MPENVSIVLLLGLFFITAGLILAVTSVLVWWPVFLAVLGISFALTANYKTVPYGMLASEICPILSLLAIFSETIFLERLIQLAGE